MSYTLGRYLLVCATLNVSRGYYIRSIDRRRLVMTASQTHCTPRRLAQSATPAVDRFINVTAATRALLSVTRIAPGNTHMSIEQRC